MSHTPCVVGIRIKPQKYHLTKSNVFIQINHSLLLTRILTMLILVHFNDHTVRSEIDEKVGSPLRASSFNLLVANDRKG